MSLLAPPERRPTRPRTGRRALTRGKARKHRTPLRAHSQPRSLLFREFPHERHRHSPHTQCESLLSSFAFFLADGSLLSVRTRMRTSTNREVAPFHEFSGTPLGKIFSFVLYFSFFSFPASSHLSFSFSLLSLSFSFSSFSLSFSFSFSFFSLFLQRRLFEWSCSISVLESVVGCSHPPWSHHCTLLLTHSHHSAC